MVNRFTKRSLTLLIALALIISVAAALASCSDGRSPTALTIGDYKVSYDLLRYFVMNYKSEYEAVAPGMVYSDAETQRQLVDNTNATLRDFAAYYMLVKKHGLKLSDDQKADVEAKIASLRNYSANDEEYKKALSDNYLTEDVLREIYTMQAYCDLLYAYLTDEYHGIFQHDDDTIMADIAEGHYFSDEYIVIHFDQNNREARMQLAENAAERVKNGTLLSKVYADLHAELSGKYYDAASMEQVDEVVYYKQDVSSKEQVLDYFSDIVTSLEVGQVSSPVEHDSSIVIVKRLELDVDNNFFDIIAAYLSRSFFNYVSDFAASLEIKQVGEFKDLDYWEIY